MSKTYLCKGCGIEKPADDFFRDKRRKYDAAIKMPCRECRSSEQKIHRANNLELVRRKERESWERHAGESGRSRKRVANLTRAAKDRGLTLDQLAEIYDGQDGRCAICGDEIFFSLPGRGNRHTACIDHDHDTGLIRGLLCQGCNTGLGLFRDDLGIVESAFIYLKRHKDG